MLMNMDKLARDININTQPIDSGTEKVNLATPSLFSTVYLP